MFNVFMCIFYLIKAAVGAGGGRSARAVGPAADGRRGRSAPWDQDRDSKQPGPIKSKRRSAHSADPPGAPRDPGGDLAKI